MIDLQSPFFRLSTDTMIILDQDGFVLAINDSGRRKIQRPLEEIIGHSIFDFVTDIAHERLRVRLKEQGLGAHGAFALDMRVGQNEVEVMRAVLDYDPLEQRFVLISSSYIAMSEDENIRWQLALESTDAGFWAWDMTADVMYFSDRFETMLGYEPGELPLEFSTLRSLVHPDDVPQNAAIVTPFLENRVRKFKFECRVRKKNGDYMWIIAMGSRAIDSQGRSVANGWHFDIDEQKRTEERLRRSEERSQLLLQSIPDLLFVFDRHGKYLEVQTSNPSSLVQPAEKILGRHVTDYFAPEFTKRWLGYLERVITEKIPLSFEYDIDVQAGHLYFEARLFPLHGDTAVAIVRDITAQKMLQTQQAMMSSSSRLTALGEMAGGIAHEINNPLTVAHAHASRLRDMAETGKPLDAATVIKSAQKIESVCMRISRIIAGLRSIARDGDNDRFVLAPLRPIVDDALSLSAEKFRHKNIELQVDRVPEVSIECRSVQISQVLVNLLLNAQHAVENLPGQRWIRLTTLEHATTVELRVSDSGLGIAPDIRERIFDPFFTTKDVGKGTGLGLSVSASIAEAHGGALYLDENEVHTTFVLILQKRHVSAH